MPDDRAAMALHFPLEIVPMRLRRLGRLALPPKAFLAAWPIAAAAFFVLGGGSFAQDVRPVGASADAAATDAADLPLLLDARMDLHNGMIEEADHNVRQYLAKHPNSPDAHYMLGFVLFRELQSRAAADSGASDAGFRTATAKASLAEYTEGAKYRAPSYLDLKIVALDYVLLEDYPDADRWLSRAVEWNPRDIESWYDLGRIKYFETSYPEAVTAFSHCLELDSKNVKAEDNLGMTYARLNRQNDAITALQNAIAWQAPLQDKNPQPFIDLGAVLIGEKRPGEAVAYLLQATKIAPGNGKAQELLSQARSLASGAQK